MNEVYTSSFSETVTTAVTTTTSVTDTTATTTTEVVRDVAYISEQLDETNEILSSIDLGIKYLLVIFLVLIAFKGVWNVFNNWYFGGV